MTNLRNALLLAAIALSSTGCMKRFILTVQDGPSGGLERSTILQTYDQGFLVTKWVYWECDEKEEKLVCKKVCDVKDDQGEKLLCPRVSVFGF